MGTREQHLPPFEIGCNGRKKESIRWFGVRTDQFLTFCL